MYGFTTVTVHMKSATRCGFSPVAEKFYNSRVRGVSPLPEKLARESVKCI